MIKKLFQNIKNWFVSKRKRKEESVTDDTVFTYTVKGDGLNIWNVKDADEIKLKKVSDNDIERLGPGSIVLTKSPLKCGNCTEPQTLMRFIGLFDLRPEDVESGMKQIQSYMNNDDVFVSLPSANIYRWEEFLNRYFRHMPGLSIKLWEHMCLEYEKDYFTKKKYDNTDYHKLAVVCIKFALHPVNYYIIPSEWIESFKINTI